MPLQLLSYLRAEPKSSLGWTALAPPREWGTREVDIVRRSCALILREANWRTYQLTRTGVVLSTHISFLARGRGW